MGLLKEFREFAQKGNVVDLAVGVVIGGAFGKIVASLVNDVIMPPIGVLIGNVKFTDLKIVLRQAVEAGPGVEAVPAVTWNYGNFIQTVMEFLIIAWAVFVLVKAINKLKRKPAPAPEEPKGPSAEELLTEIRDLLAKRG